MLLPEPLLHNVLQARQLPALSQFLKVFELLLAVGQVQGYMALDVLQDRRELGPAAQQQGPPQCVCALKSVPKKGALRADDKASISEHDAQVLAGRGLVPAV